MKKIFKPPIAAILMCFLLLHGKAQAQEEEKEQKIKRYEWEVATNIMPFFFSNNKSPYSSFVRKNFIRIRNKKLIKRAYRMGIDFDSRTQNATLNYPNTPFSTLIDDFGDFTTISLRLGYEWQVHLQKFHFYYGYEVFGTYSTLFFDITNSVNNINGIIYTENKQVDFGIRGLAGVKYFIHPRFAISAETGFFVKHIIENSLKKQRNFDNQIEEFSYQRGVNIVQSAPLFAVNLSVLF
jgi:hypothetical protein